MGRYERPKPKGVANRQAPRPLVLPADCGIAVSLAAFPGAVAALTPYGLSSRVVGCQGWPFAEPLPFERTLLLASPLALDYTLLPATFGMLERWNAVAPIYSYDALAETHGTPKERDYTRGLVRDLRVPLFETGALFLRRCNESAALMDAWRRERDEWPDGAESRLAFHRAYWRVKPLFLALPVSYVAGRAA